MSKWNLIHHKNQLDETILEIRDNKGNYICGCENPSPTPQDVANFKLIAAAPILLQQLKDIKEQVDQLQIVGI